MPMRGKVQRNPLTGKMRRRNNSAGGYDDGKFVRMTSFANQAGLCCPECLGSCVSVVAEDLTCPLVPGVPAFYDLHFDSLVYDCAACFSNTGRSQSVQGGLPNVNGRTFRVTHVTSSGTDSPTYIYEESLGPVGRVFAFDPNCSGFPANVNVKLQVILVVVRLPQSFEWHATALARVVSDGGPIVFSGIELFNARWPLGFKKMPGCCRAINGIEACVNVHLSSLYRGAHHGTVRVNACGNTCGEQGDGNCPPDADDCPSEIECQIQFTEGGPFQTLCLERLTSDPIWTERPPRGFNASIRCELLDNVPRWKFLISTSIQAIACRYTFFSEHRADIEFCPRMGGSPLQWFLHERAGTCADPTFVPPFVLFPNCNAGERVGVANVEELLKSSSSGILMPVRVRRSSGGGCGCSSADYRDGPTIGFNPTLSARPRRRGGHCQTLSE
jgi:hypothetical protein